MNIMKRTATRPATGTAMLATFALAATAALMATAGAPAIETASALAAQETREARLQQAFPGPTGDAIREIIADAAEDGIPTEPLYDKALEGAAKRIPPPSVERALSEYARRMADARSLLGPEARPPWIVAGADALGRGVGEDAVRGVGAEAGPRTPMALVVLGDLVEAGLPPERAMEVLRAAMERRRTDAGLLEVPPTLRRLIRDGAGSPDAARRVIRALQQGRSLRTLRGATDRPGAFRRPVRPVPPGSDPTDGRVTERRFGIQP